MQFALQRKSILFLTAFNAMCRILGYLGPQISLDRLVTKPDHSMVVQSYKPKELDNAVLNGDGFGFGWHGSDAGAPPFVYRHILPMWNDRNLDDLCRYIRSQNFVVNLRSATSKMPVDFSNCQPFAYRNLLFVHNGLIENFFNSLQRPIREMLCDKAYRSIKGLTDSEHIFALLVHHLEMHPGIDPAEALHKTMTKIIDLAKQHNVRVAANIILSLSAAEATDPPNRLIALRYDNQQQAPSFYLLKDSERFPKSVILTSEALFEADWQPYTQGELVSIDSDLQMTTHGELK